MTDIEKASMLLAKARFPFLPWQSLNQDDEWRDVPINNTFEKLVEHFACYGKARFDPLFVWPYPPETREGVPVWYRFLEPGYYPSEWGRGFINQGVLYSMEETDNIATAVDDESYEIRACDPRNLQEPPPTDWTPEGKRIIE
jgi:hypothetical protein